MISWCCAIDSDPKWNKSFFWLLLLINLPSKRGFHSLSMVVWHATSYTHCRTSANRIAPFEKPKNRSRFVLFTLHMATLENGITCEDCVSDCHCQVSGFQHQIVVPITSIGFGIGRAQVTMDGRSGTMHNGTKVHGEQVVATIRCVSLGAALTLPWQFDFSVTWTCVTARKRKALTAVCPVGCHSSRLHLSTVFYHNVINMLAQLLPLPPPPAQQSIGLKWFCCCWWCKAPSSKWVSEWEWTVALGPAKQTTAEELLAVESTRITIYLCSPNDIL